MGAIVAVSYPALIRTALAYSAVANARDHHIDSHAAFE